MAIPPVDWSNTSVNPTLSVFTPGTGELASNDSDLLYITLSVKAPTAADTIDGLWDDGVFVSDTLEIRGDSVNTSINFATLAEVSGFELTVLDPDSAASFSATLTSNFVTNNTLFGSNNFLIAVKGSTVAPVTLDASAVSATAANAILVRLGDAGDSYVGSAGVDIVELFGVGHTGGSDSIGLGNGNDIFVPDLLYLTASDTVDGGAGFDEIHFYSNATISGGAAFTNVTGFERFVFGLDGGVGTNFDVTLTDTIMPKLTGNIFEVGIADMTSAQTFVLNAGALTATYAVNVVYNTAFSPYLTMTGGAGADTLRGGDGTSVALNGKGGNDILFTGAGSTTATSGDGADTVIGGSGADFATGDNDSDLLFGNGGSDTLDGGANADTVSGGTEADSLYGGLGADSLDGGFGDDTIVASAEASDAGGDSLRGGAGADIFQVKAAVATPIIIQDLSFDDRIEIWDGGAQLTANPTKGGTFAQGEWDVVTIAGGLSLSVGLDAAAGADATITLLGSFLPGQISAVGGLLLLSPDAATSFGAGNDTLTGDGTNNLFWLPKTAGFLSATDSIDGAGGTADRIVIEGSTTADFSGLSAANFKGIELIETQGGTNSITLPSAAPVTFLDGAGNDYVTVSGGSGHVLFLDGGGPNTAELSGGSSTVVINSGSVTVSGGSHVIHLSGTATMATPTASVTVVGSAGYTTDISGSNLADQLFLGSAGEAYGLDGADQLVGSSDDDTLEGGLGADTLFGGEGHDILNGGDSSDQYVPDTANDLLVAGGGNDTIFVGGGDDTAYGQGGSDVFRFFDVLTGHVTIADYQIGELVDFFDTEFDVMEVDAALDDAEIFDNAIRFELDTLTITIVGINDVDDLTFVASSGKYGI